MAQVLSYDKRGRMYHNLFNLFIPNNLLAENVVVAIVLQRRNDISVEFLNYFYVA